MSLKPDPSNKSEHEQVRRAVRSALTLAYPELQREHPLAYGGMGLLDKHLDDLIEIVPGTSGNDLHHYLARLQERVCPRCEYQFCNGFCPLREMEHCSLRRYAAVMFEAIAGALENMGDATFEANRRRRGESEPATGPS